MSDRAAREANLDHASLQRNEDERSIGSGRALQCETRFRFGSRKPAPLASSSREDFNHLGKRHAPIEHESRGPPSKATNGGCPVPVDTAVVWPDFISPARVLIGERSVRLPVDRLHGE